MWTGAVRGSELREYKSLRSLVIICMYAEWDIPSRKKDCWWWIIITIWTWDNRDERTGPRVAQRWRVWAGSRDCVHVWSEVYRQVDENHCVLRDVCGLIQNVWIDEQLSRPYWVFVGRNCAPLQTCDSVYIHHCRLAPRFYRVSCHFFIENLSAYCRETARCLWLLTVSKYVNT